MCLNVFFYTHEVISLSCIPEHSYSSLAPFAPSLQWRWRDWPDRGSLGRPSIPRKVERHRDVILEVGVDEVGVRECPLVHARSVARHRHLVSVKMVAEAVNRIGRQARPRPHHSLEVRRPLVRRQLDEKVDVVIDGDHRRSFRPPRRTAISVRRWNDHPRNVEEVLARHSACKSRGQGDRGGERRRSRFV